MKRYNVFLCYFISILFMEIVFKFLTFKSIFALSSLYVLCYVAFISMILTILSKLFNKKINSFVMYLFLILIAIWFSAQYVCKDYFDFYISWNLFEVADQMNDFLDKCIIETFKRIVEILVFFLPIFLISLLNKKISYEKIDLRDFSCYFILGIISYIIFLGLLQVGKDKDYSNYKLYYEINDVSLNIENLGIVNTFIIDTKRSLFGFSEELLIHEEYKNEDKKEDIEIVYELNNLDIDFEKLYNDENDNTLKSMHSYFNNEIGTYKNEYTSMFKDKNLILIMAESFNEVAVDQNLTPTLYKLANNGFHFNNFYTPTIYSTIGGEFQELTGLYAANVSILNKFRSGANSFPLGIGTEFKNKEYKTFAYHNNSYVFQDRNKYLKSLGFDNFKACYNGLEKSINCKIWPQSDVEMINSTINDYINEDKFMVFYATVSGHAPYNWSSNQMARKHKDEAIAMNYNYSEGAYSYLAAQMELDRALESLIKLLEENNKLQDTIIALVGDHYPYELTIDQINELSSKEKDGIVEVNRSNFILWNSEMKTIEIDKVGSQIDVLPTIYNLFGIDYDSRLFIGKDILSTTPGLAIFANRSWVSDYGTYFSNSKTFVPKDNKEVSEEYVAQMNQQVNNKINMSKLIIQNDYYRKISKNTSTE